MVSNHNQRTFYSLMLPSAVAISGCGKADKDAPLRASASGVVTFDGTPLKEGVIRFVPIDDTDGPKTSVNVQDGKFEINGKLGPVIGQHRIEIESTDTGGYAMDDEDAIENLHKAGIKRIEVVKIPMIYNSRSTLKENRDSRWPERI